MTDAGTVTSILKLFQCYFSLVKCNATPSAILNKSRTMCKQQIEEVSERLQKIREHTESLRNIKKDLKRFRRIQKDSGRLVIRYTKNQDFECFR